MKISAFSFALLCVATVASPASATHAPPRNDDPDSAKYCEQAFLASPAAKTCPVLEQVTHSGGTCHIQAGCMVDGGTATSMSSISGPVASMYELNNCNGKLQFGDLGC